MKVLRLYEAAEILDQRHCCKDLAPVTFYFRLHIVSISGRDVFRELLHGLFVYARVYQVKVKVTLEKGMSAQES